MTKTEYRERLKQHELRVTPQRLAVMEAVDKLHNHPTVEEIGRYIHRFHPNIASGTIYKSLDTLVEKGILKRVNTGHGVMRYDAVAENHHHLYSSSTDRIEDYYNAKISSMLEDYFRKNKIKGFTVSEIKLQLTGEFKNRNTKN